MGEGACRRDASSVVRAGLPAGLLVGLLVALLVAMLIVSPGCAATPPPTSAGIVCVVDVPPDAPDGLRWIDIKRWESEHGRIPNGARLVIRGGDLAPEGSDYLATYRDPAAIVVVAPGDAATPDAARDAGLHGVPEPPAPSPAPRETRLLEFGWDIPNAQTLADAAAAGTPFDGAVFDPILGELPDGEPDRFAWMAFSRRAIDDEAVARIVADLARTPPPFRASSLLRVNVTPGEVDWLEPGDAIVANARAAGRIVGEARLAGILLDVEQYAKPIFDYQARPRHAEVAFERYADAARSRGRSFARALAEGAPDAEILLTYGYPLASRDRIGRAFGLLPAFIDGLIEGGRPGIVVTDGYELSYPFRTREAFARGRAEVLRESDGATGVGFGIWIDWNSGTLGFDAAAPERNWFTPDQLAASIGHALTWTDRWVWIYSERLDWWTGRGLAEPYVAAVRRARASGR